MAQMRKLVQKRNSTKNDINKLSIFLNKYDTSEEIVGIGIEELDVRIGILNKLFDTYNEINDEIICNDNNNVDVEDVFEIYQSLLIKIEKLKTKIHKPVKCTFAKGSNNTTSNLPDLDIPIFDGRDVTQFNTFYELFVALIDNDDGLSNIQKFCYLKKFLKGEALEVISSLPVIDTSYKTAMELIKNRFNRRNLIINAHLKCLFEIPNVTAGSPKNVREFVSKIRQQVGCLKNLSEPVDSWDCILVYMFSNKLDQYTNRAYQLDKNQNTPPNLEEFLLFLEKRAMSMEASNSNPSKFIKPKSAVNIATNLKNNTKFSRTVKKINCLETSCLYCNVPNHKLYSCMKFKNISVRERIEFVQQNNLCKKCLNHHSGTCTYRPCILCSNDHNALLHVDEQQNQINTIISGHQTASTYIKNNFTQVLLPTAQVKVKTGENKYVIVKCLLDSGSQTSFVTKKCVEMLRLNQNVKNLEISGISTGKTNVTHSAVLEINSITRNYKVEVECSIIEKITTSLPQFYFDKANIKIPENIKLADVTFNEPTEISMLLGADIFFELLLDGTIKLGSNQPILQNTLLGYVVSGSVMCNKFNKIKASHAVSLHIANVDENFQITNEELNESLTRFWDIETFPEQELLTEKDICESLFKESFSRINGRFQVKLPLKLEIKNLNLGDSYSVAIKRFANLEKRFKVNPNLLSQYTKFIDEYIQLGHAKQFDIRNYEVNNESVYFMAHHPVLREESKTTKLRVVFDGSMKTKFKTSLNDVMYNGQILQSDLFDVLIMFRSYEYVFVADIKQMYRQILIHPDHKQLLNILWRPSVNQPVQCLQLQTVTYGLKASPHLATRCLMELAHQEDARFPLASKAIANNCYIDDFLCGSNDLTEALEMQAQLIEMLGTAHFELHKWCANHPALLVKIANNKVSSSDIELNSKEIIKTLGLSFDMNADEFKISCPTKELNQRETKRTVLGFISKFYDPLGLVGPIIVNAKLFMQKLWKENISWDEDLPNDLFQTWTTFANNLIQMAPIKIPRNLKLKTAKIIELVGFCDASMQAYGCSIYLRVVQDDRVKVSLLCSKSRIAPLNKKLTIPKLELNGALLLAKLANRTQNLLKEHLTNVVLYSDSTISLAWIKNTTLKLDVYVANRVKEIRRLTNNCYWLFVKSEENPADCLSRGVDPQTLHENNLWWNGPMYLTEQVFQYDIKNKLVTTHEFEKINVNMCVKEIDKLVIFDKCSSINKMIRIVAYCIRFLNNCRSKSRQLGNLTVAELQRALIVILKNAQKNELGKTIKELNLKGEVNCNLKSLFPFLDSNGLLRVGGRLQNAQIPFDKKHPIILPKKCHISTLIIRNEHLALLHGGVKIVLASLREKYWLLNSNREIKKVLHKCVTCFRLKAKASQQLMGSLPADRITPARSFQKVGIDFGGPFFIKQSRLRSVVTSKGYIALFVCFVTKAIHIELVSDLTTETFMSALKRFIGRRGRPTIIYSDNGSTFKGTNNQLKELFMLISSKQHKDKVIDTASTLGIQWSFIPSYSPVFGGLWEAGIKSAKYHIKRVMGKNILTYEQFNTVLIQIESILNSRPLCPLTNDTSDMSYLTPGHFIIGTKFTNIPEPECIEVPINRLKFWKQCTQVQQSFWKMWSKDYILQLQNRPKWQKINPNVHKDALVLIIEDNRIPLEWKVGRISKLIKGKDGIVRVVEIFTGNSKILTSISKIAVLPVYEKD